MRSTPPSLDVPPLSDAAIGRIERGVLAALDAEPRAPARARESRRRLLAFSMAGAVAAAAVFGVREWRRGEGSSARAARITTTTSGSRIAIEGAALEIAPESAVSFGAGKDGATVVVLDRGTVTCEVAPRTARAPFVVQAGETRVTVIGTRFSVNRVGDHATVSVEHGLVEVADTNMTELVHAGERFRPGEPVARAPLATSPAEAPPEAPAEAPAEATAVAPAEAPAVALLQASPVEPPVARVATPARPAPERRLALGAPRTRARVESAGAELAGAEVAAPAVADAPREAVETTSAASPGETPAAAEAPAAESRRGSPQGLFELAAQLEVRDPEAALGIYEQLASADDAWAASALFASARLAAERGRPPTARAACEDYLRRFPRGTNADDARALLAGLPQTTR